MHFRQPHHALQPRRRNQASSNGNAQSTWSTSRRIFLTRHWAHAQICGGG